MVIEKHPGPNGQVFYRDERPEGHDNPARFCSLKKCLFPYHLEREQLDWTATAIYATDYSSVDYSFSTEGETTYISSHTAPETFGHAEELVYVVKSDIQGAMGPDFIPFSTRADAETFTTNKGGDIVAYDDIDEGLIGR
jgi:nitrous oxide reductase accessory protein NosL